MGFELFQRKQQAFNELMQAIERIKSVLPLLSSDETQALMDGLKDAIESHRAAGATERVSGAQPVIVGNAGTLPPPGAAVESLVLEHPEGLRAREIIDRLLGKIETASDDPKAVLYSALAFLKRNKRIVQDDHDKKYRPPPRAKQSESSSLPRASLAGRGGPECCERILREHGKPMSVRAIALEAMSRGYGDRYAKTAANSEEAVDFVTRKLARAMSGDERFDEPIPGTFVLKE